MLNLYIMMKKLLFLLLISVYLLGSFEISKAISGADTGQDCRIKPGGGKTCDACVTSYCAKD